MSSFVGSSTCGRTSAKDLIHHRPTSYTHDEVLTKAVVGPGDSYPRNTRRHVEDSVSDAAAREWRPCAAGDDLLGVGAAGVICIDREGPVVGSGFSGRESDVDVLECSVGL